VVVEGVHGAGKTTVSEMLRDRFGAALLHFTPEFGRFRQDAELDVKVAPLPRLLHYLAATMQVSDLAKAHLESRHVVCDRYLVSSLTLLASDPSVTAQEVATIVATYEPYYCPPDLTLLLTVEHSVATTRLRGRADRIVTNSQRESTGVFSTLAIAHEERGDEARILCRNRYIGSFAQRNARLRS